MIEESLINYGVLGIWTITLLAEKIFNEKHIKKVIESNTQALTKIYEVMTKCRKK